MKIKIFDLALNDKEEIEEFVKSHHIVDVKHSAARDACPVIVMYEEPNILQQQSFYTRTGEKEINHFLASHDVVKVDHTSADHGEIITTIVYRKVIKKVDPWGDKTSEDDLRTEHENESN